MTNLFLENDQAGRPLTDREREILAMVGDGKSNQAIADTLGLTRQTIKNHNHKIYLKLEAHSRTEAVYNALCRGELVLA